MTSPPVSVAGHDAAAGFWIEEIARLAVAADVTARRRALIRTALALAELKNISHGKRTVFHAEVAAGVNPPASALHRHAKPLQAHHVRQGQFAVVDEHARVAARSVSLQRPAQGYARRGESNRRSARHPPPPGHFVVPKISARHH